MTLEPTTTVEILSETNRKLASVQRIAQLKPIEGADRIQLCLLEGLGWECVVKKGDFNVNDKVVYIETDSRVPERPEFEFLRERKFKVKIIKLKKQVSQGLVMPLSILPNGNYNLGDDVTAILGVVNYVKAQENADENAQINHKTRVPKFLMNMAWFRWVYFKLNHVDKGWPVKWIQKSDETRIQTIAKILMEHFNEDWYISEKVDGMSGGFFTYYSKKWGFNKLSFGVCSRNIFLKTPNDSKYWAVAKEYELEQKLKAATEKGQSFSVQAELAGPGIQKNKYNFSKTTPFVFNVCKNRIRVSLKEMLNYCETFGLQSVPIVQEVFNPAKEIGDGKTVQEVVRFMVEKSKGKSMLANRNREGIVCRLHSDPFQSLKVINPDFLLAEKDEEEFQVIE